MNEMPEISNGRAQKLLEWAWATLKNIDPDELTDFERELLERIEA